AMLATAQPDSVSTQLQALQSTPFMERVYKAAGIQPNSEVVPPSVSVTALEGTNVLQITAEGGDPKVIAKLANTMVDLHTQDTTVTAKGGMDRTIDFVGAEKQKT